MRVPCGAVHGEPQLENVLARGVGEVCIIDFGHAVMDPSETRCELELAQVDEMWSTAMYLLTELHRQTCSYAEPCSTGPVGLTGATPCCCVYSVVIIS